MPASATAPYRPVTEALLQLLRRRPLPDDPSLAPWLPHLTALLPGVVAGGPAPRLGRGVDSQAVRGEAVLQLLRRLGPDGLVVALEDLHWADPDTVSLVDYLADNAAGQPVLFAVSLRAEPPSPASDLARRQRGRAGIVHLPLGRLSEREVAEMITACSPGADTEERSRVRRTSEGVPLFVEELLASPGIPETISDTVRGRLAEFPDRERAVLEAAAVLEHHFDWEILPAASGQPPEVVSRALLRGTCRAGPACQGLIDELVHLIGPLYAQHQDHLRVRGRIGDGLGRVRGEGRPRLDLQRISLPGALGDGGGHQVHQHRAQPGRTGRPVGN